MLVLHDRGPHTRPVPQQRYEPLPSLDQLPAWLWRRTSRPARIALGVSVLVAVTLTAVLVPAIRRDQQARAAAQQRADVVRHAATVKALQFEQRPRFGRSPAPARPAMLSDLEAAIAGDARRRGLDGPIRRARCEPFPKRLDTPPPETDPRVAS